MTGRNDTTVIKVLGYQILLIFVVVAGFAIKDEQYGLSAGLGGLAAFIPNL